MTADALELPAMLRLNVAKMKKLREALELTQVSAAKRAGMVLSRWNDIESGGRSNVTIETLGVIAVALECDPSELLMSDAKGRKPR